MGTVGEFHGEVVGLSNNDFGVEGFLADLAIMPSGILAGILPRKDFRGNGGNYFFGSNSGGTLAASASLDRVVEEGFVRWCVMRPATLGTLGTVSVGGYGLGGSIAHWEVNLLANGALQVETDTLLRQTSSTTIFTSDTAWVTFEIWWRIHASAGHIKVYKDFNYASPVLDFTGDVLRNSGQANADRLYLSFGPSTGGDDIKVQDITLTYEDGFGILTIVAGDTVDVYNATGATAATGTFSVSMAPPAAGDLTIGGVTLTATGGARTSGANDFDASSGVADTVAQSITDAINDAANGFAHMVTAVNSGGGVATLTATTTGLGGNSIALTSGSADITAAGMASGVDGTKIGEALVTAVVGTQLAGQLQLRQVENGAAVAWDGLIANDPFSGAVYVQEQGATPWSANTPLSGLDPDSGFPGEGFYYAARVPTSTVTGDLTLTGAATHHEAMDGGLDATGEASYVSNSTGGTLGDMFGFGTVLPVTGAVTTIRGVTTYLRVRKDGVGVDNFAHTQDLGGGKLVGPIEVLPASFEVNSHRMAYQPGTAGTDWTHAALVGTNFGLDIIP